VAAKQTQVRGFARLRGDLRTDLGRLGLQGLDADCAEDRQLSGGSRDLEVRDNFGTRLRELEAFRLEASCATETILRVFSRRAARADPDKLCLSQIASAKRLETLRDRRRATEEQLRRRCSRLNLGRA